MGRRLLWVVVGAITATMAWVSGAPANGSPCGIARTRVVKETRSALIVRSTRGEYSRYYGCLKTTGRPVLVAREYLTEDWDEILFSEDYLRLRGRFAAISMVACLEGCALVEIAVWDLSTGVRVRLVAGLKGVGDDPYRVMLSRHGALAYVADDGFRRVLVVKADAGGHAVVKRGSSRNLPPSSVRLRGHRLSWEFKGKRQSVRLR